MAAVSNRAKGRLENLKAIEPLLGSLRVLSLSTMQLATNRQESIQAYASKFVRILAALQPAKNKAAPTEKTFSDQARSGEKSLLVILGSSRGICGQYNHNLAAIAAKLTRENNETKRQLMAFGTRLQTILRVGGMEFIPQEAISRGSTPNYALASRLMREWIAGYTQAEIARVDILSFRRQTAKNGYEPMITNLVPDALTPVKPILDESSDWPEPIIEGDAEVLTKKISEHLAAIRFYELILDAIIAENRYRYQLLEEAKENASTLIEELSLAIQIDKRQAVTQQLQELVVGSGMLMQR